MDPAIANTILCLILFKIQIEVHVIGSNENAEEDSSGHRRGAPYKIVTIELAMDAAQAKE